MSELGGGSENPRDTLRPAEGGTPTVELIPPTDVSPPGLWYRGFVDLVVRQTGITIELSTATNITDSTLDNINRSHKGRFGPDYVTPEYMRQVKEVRRREEQALDRAANRIEERRKNPPVYAESSGGWKMSWIYDHNGMVAYYELRIMDSQNRVVIEAQDNLSRNGPVRVAGSLGEQKTGFIYSRYDYGDVKEQKFILTKGGRVQKRKFGILGYNDSDRKVRVAEVIDSLPADFHLV